MNNQRDILSTEFLKQRYMLMAFIRGMLKDDNTAEDMFQEVWLQLAAACEKGVLINDLPKWSRGVARNLILKHWRKSKNGKAYADSEILDLVAVSFEEQDTNQKFWDEHRIALRECMDSLPENSRKLLKIRYEKNKPITLIAEKMNKSASSIMTTLSRLRKKLRGCAKLKLKEISIP
jgi:RNA polymerase sigma-70 factor, ECF subfamily